jgi:hypothetical protein
VLGFLIGAALLAADASAATGGPDTYGYTWRDSNEPGVAYAWEDITLTGTDITLRADDGNTGLMPLSFGFWYRGRTYDSVAACTNGWASLSDGSSDNYGNVPLPDPGVPSNLLAGYWDDLTLRSNGRMWFQDFGDHVVLSWIDVPHYDVPADRATFQIILFNDGRIKVQLQQIEGAASSATIGIQNLDGTDGLTAYVDAPIQPLAYAVEFVPPPILPPLLGCASATPLPCGSVMMGDLALGAANQSEYRCRPGDFSGREQIYAVDLPAPTSVRFRFDVLTGSPQLFILPACDPNDCSVPASGLIALSGAMGQFWFVVDCAPGEEGQYVLSAECLPLTTSLDCSSAAPLGCGSTVSADLADGAANQPNYWCSLADYSGREQIYLLDVPVQVATATITLNAVSGNPDLIVLYPCDANACLAPPGDVVDLPGAVGPYFVVVDCAAGEEGAYDLVVSGTGAGILRDVGNALRATSHALDSVGFDWSIAGPPLPTEHYVVLRSDRSPTGPFTLEVALPATAWTDPNAPPQPPLPHVWFYNVLRADACGNTSND